ncbi:DUF512 domain-containing protein [Clostridium sp. D2Q-11]|uniref:DUF512 domain-containing protein n=1 Tax=Anaeromonas frigoriresistens TaxID=2683708 RepID=A0A942Z8E4_9FIRM|nr:DUF512 domain-containing protein [Anaeromonas frigoriresistens]MBS4539707.1 DUF512 domain-containing protein [Anaeromonas frigoriresistens]
MELRNIDKNANIVEEVMKDSIAEELGVEKGDILLSINGQDIKDIIDYKFHIADDYVLVDIQKPNGEVWELEIEKEYDEDLGINFSNPLIDRAKNCRNNCMFCFIDQLPKGMRETLYFKDDDSRLSFLQGNFITLTNMSEEEIDRIIKYRISPINISVHTTNPDLRIRMLNNKNAGKLYNILKRFNEADIKMNAQIVLIPEVNDGSELKRTVKELAEFYPNIESMAVVPVGITEHRKELPVLDYYDKEKSQRLLEEIKSYQNDYLVKIGTRFVFASDEFYILAEKPIPSFEEYEGFPQIENGVGLLREFKNGIENELLNLKDIELNKTVLIATGTSAYKFMEEVSEMISSKIKGLNIKVISIKNRFFGETITVSGLVTGSDLLEQVNKVEGFDELIIPRSMLRSGEEIFLDDVTLEEINNKLNKSVLVSEVNGKDFISTLINKR